MLASARIKAFIKNQEGLRLEVYNDGEGNLTIGYGHELPKGDTTKYITIAQVETLFEQDIFVAEQAINSHIKVSLLQQEFDALVDFTFNLGSVAFAESTVLMYLNEGQKLEAASWLTRYCHVGKIPLVGLLLRRLKEASIFMGIPIGGY